MQTRCPHCQTVTTLATDDPAAAGGIVCPTCAIPFNALKHRCDSATDATGGPVDAGADGNQGDLFTTRTRPATAMAVPRFARGRARAPSAWRWWVAALLLLALLTAIVPIANRDVLAADPDWRPRIESICGIVGCNLPPWHEPSAFRTTASEFNPHPTVKGARLVTVSFRNTAPFAQAWPLLELTVSDINGRVVGRRRFHPSEYLGGAPESPLLQPDQSASATLEVVDPDAVTWVIEFR